MPQSKPLREGKSTRRVHVTLTREQDAALRALPLYALCNRRLATVIAQLVTEGILREMERAGRR